MKGHECKAKELLLFSIESCSSFYFMRTIINKSHSMNAQAEFNVEEVTQENDLGSVIIQGRGQEPIETCHLVEKA